MHPSHFCPSFQSTIFKIRPSLVTSVLGRPFDFHYAISAAMSARTLSGFGDLEDVLLTAGRIGGTCVKQKQRFRESPILQSLRSDRRRAQTVEERKRLTFMIQTKHKQELQTWKSLKMNELLSRKSSWKTIPHLQEATHQKMAGHPAANEFADMLEQLFAGDPGGELQPPRLTEAAWEKSDVYKAIKRMKPQKSADERGVVAELLKHAPDIFIAKLVDGFNDLMSSGEVPHEWRKTLFKMLRKNLRSRVPSDYRPIASIRLFYKVFAYMILGRVEAQLESTQPEEQHGFRSGRRVEEHLVTTQVLLDKLLRANVPIWIISLDLSKAFDRVSWPALWRALSQQGLSNHMIWMLQNLYRNQEGQVFANDVCSRSFPIRGGVRQGCVLSPRLFNSVLEMAMACWRASVENLGLDLRDGGPALLDFRFADDILIFGTSYHVIGALLDKLVENLAAVGLQLNVDKTKILTSQAQPPQRLQTPNGLTISIIDQESSHKWLGCMLTTTLEKSTTCDVDHRLQSASKIFNANRWILCDTQVAIAKRLEYFDCIISPVACYAAGHRSIYEDDLHRFDVLQRRFLRSVVGPPRNIDWTLPRHEILHQWNGRIQRFMGQSRCKPWSEMCLRHHWNLAHYFALLPDHRWLKRVLHWNPCGRRRVGRPKHSWDSILGNFCRFKDLPFMGDGGHGSGFVVFNAS